jgi:uncharacterized protein YyaL (SSP411 family)
MEAIDDVWRNKPDDIRQNVDALVESISATTRIEPAADLPGDAHLRAALDQLAKTFDRQWGGFGGAPKFPSTMSLDLVLRAHVQHPSDGAREIVQTSLAAMASGGMYDHIGGGFARYSTDEQWLVPHFEKMLYDQALLTRVYIHAALAFDDPVSRQVATETIEYVLRDLRHADGGFFSAEDADSPDEHGHGHEGLFATWTPGEVRDVLGDDAHVAIAWYELDGEANFEGRWIPCRLRHRGELLRPLDVEEARARLFASRETRRRPGLDDKVLTEWNGLMLASLAEAAAAFGRDDWLAAAIANGEFLLRELRAENGRWFRSWHAAGDPRARHAALAADHAALVDAFTRLGEATGQARWTEEAQRVADAMLDHFWDPVHGGLFTTADDSEELVVRQKDLMDNATPSANSIAAVALIRLAALTGERRYDEHADSILRLLGRVIASAPSAFSNALAAVDLRRTGVTEVVVAGDRRDLLDVVRERWRPNVVVAWGEPSASPLWVDRPSGFAYVCEGAVCQLPTADREVLRRQLDAAGST